MLYVDDLVLDRSHNCDARQKFSKHFGRVWCR